MSTETSDNTDISGCLYSRSQSRLQRVCSECLQLQWPPGEAGAVEVVGARPLPLGDVRESEVRSYDELFGCCCCCCCSSGGNFLKASRATEAGLLERARASRPVAAPVSSISLRLRLRLGLPLRSVSQHFLVGSSRFSRFCPAAEPSDAATSGTAPDALSKLTRRVRQLGPSSRDYTNCNRTLFAIILFSVLLIFV